MKKLLTLFAMSLFAVGMSAQRWVPIVQNSDMEGTENANFVAKESNGPTEPAAIIDGIGVDGSRGIQVVSAPGAGQDWDTQFWIVFDEPLYEGDVINVSFDYKATTAVTVGPQAHGVPGDYHDYTVFGWGKDANFDTEWKTYEGTCTVGAGMANNGNGGGFLSIAFNLSTLSKKTDQSDGIEVTYYFDNIYVTKMIPKEIQWTSNLIPNGDCEADADFGFIKTDFWRDEHEGNVFSFVGREPGMPEDPCIENGVGVDGTRGVAVHSVADAVNEYDTQFFITSTHKFQEGEHVIIKFDYKSDDETNVTVQWHALPGDYIDWQGPGESGNGINFTSQWQHYEKEIVISSAASGGGTCQTLAFNLNENRNLATTFYFDNIEMYIDRDFASDEDWNLIEKVMAGPPAPQATWTVAGNFLANQWNPEDATNDMTLGEDGSYTLVVKDVTLEKGANYEFKVVKDHAWDEAYPSENYVFNVDETAIYTVTITFNAETQAINVTTEKTGDVTVIPEATWTVAGNFLGSSWNPEDASNDMTLEGDLYTLVKTDVTLEKGTSYEFKVVKDHAWTVAYPSNNYTFTVDETGIYTVTVTFNAETQEINVTTVKTGEAGPVEHTYSVMGTLGGDSWTVDNDMTKGEDGIYTITFDDVAAGNYEFKVRVDHDWSVAYPGSNYQLTVDQDGSKVVITFNEETKEVNAIVTAPAEETPATIWEGDGSAGAVSWNGIYRFALEGHDGANECIAEIPQAIWDKMMTETFYADIQGENPQIRITTGWWDTNLTANDIQPGNELLTDNGDGTWTIKVNLADNPDLVALLVDHHLLFTGSGYTLMKLYFNDATGIQAPVATQKAVNGAIYNLSGQKVNANYKGIVIVNGKKVLMK